MRDYFRLHLVILLWGTTAVLGNLIELSAIQVVLYRSFLAAGLLAVLLGRQAVLPKGLFLSLIANGSILGAHWVFFFLAVKIANVSVCMVGMATISFWTALLEPLLMRNVRFQKRNVYLGLIVIAAVYVIFRNESQFHRGALVALLSALLATLFSIFNGSFTNKASEKVIVMYEMAGAGLFCLIALGVAPLWGFQWASDRWMPTLTEWGWLAILVSLCTVYAYLLYVELLKRLSVFTINFANNLEPVYGIALGAVLFADHQHVGPGFYAGTTIIMSAVIIQAYLERQTTVAPT